MVEVCQPTRAGKDVGTDTPTRGGRKERGQMAPDEQVPTVLRAIEMLDGRVRASTSAEIGFLVPLPLNDLERVLTRAVLGGWVARRAIASGDGARAGEVVYQLTDVGYHRAPAA